MVTFGKGGASTHGVRNTTAILVIKVVHTIIWAVLAGCILVLPVTGVFHRFGWGLIPTVAVLIECGILAANRGRCPLTTVAAQLTDSRTANFDIFLPNWLARYNKVIFGSLFVAGEMVLIGCWLGSR